MTAHPLEEETPEPAVSELVRMTALPAAELVARSLYLHEEIVKTAIFGREPLSVDERAKFQPFVDALLEYWHSGNTAGLGTTYLEAQFALESLLADREAARTAEHE